MTSPAPSPIAQKLGGVMLSHGYTIASGPTAAARPITDVSVALQIGNVVTFAADGIPTLQIECALHLRGSEPAGHASGWRAKKLFPVSPAHAQVGLSLQLDVTVAGIITPAFASGQYLAGYARLRSLIADCCEALRELPVVHEPVVMDDQGGPVVVVEVSTIGDLVVGKGGLGKAARACFPSSDVAWRLEACDGLVYEILPDLMQAALAFRETAEAYGPLSSRDTRSLATTPSVAHVTGSPGLADGAAAS